MRSPPQCTSFSLKYLVKWSRKELQQKSFGPKSSEIKIKRESADESNVVCFRSDVPRILGRSAKSNDRIGAPPARHRTRRGRHATPCPIPPDLLPPLRKLKKEKTDESNLAGLRSDVPRSPCGLAKSHNGSNPHTTRHRARPRRHSAPGSALPVADTLPEVRACVELRCTKANS